MRQRVAEPAGATTMRAAPAPTPAAVPASQLPITQRLPREQLPDAQVHQPVVKLYPPKIAKALLEVASKVQPVEKAGINDFHKYAYPKWEDIRDELWPLMTAAGLIVIQDEVQHEGLERDMIAISYTFTILNVDGDVWPIAPKVTAICKIRDNKGVLDDKAASKCRTQAEKNCMVQLFKIRTEDVYEVDNDGRVGKNSPRMRPVPSPDGKMAPHYIQGVEGETAQTWAVKFIAFINKAASAAEIDEWEKLNGKLLDLCEQRDVPTYNSIIDAMLARAGSFNQQGEHQSTAVATTVAAQAESKFPGDKPVTNGEPIPVRLDRQLTDNERDWLIQLADAYAQCHTVEEIEAERDSILMPAQDTVSGYAWNRALDLTDDHIDRVGGKR